jgi:protoporphyrinogen oxidase
MSSINRRDLLVGMLGASAAGVAMNAMIGCHRAKLPTRGVLLEQNYSLGHRLRERPATWSTPTEWQHIPVIIVGSGIAGLAAGWQLQRSGVTEFAIFELEDQYGGTSRSSTEGQFKFPWAAHYITTPLPENQQLIELLLEMGVAEGLAGDGAPIIAEQHLCREPEERLFQDGQWIDGIYPSLGATPDDLQQLEQFQQSMRMWSQKRDPRGRKYFAIPIASCSDDPDAIALDQLSMAQWMQQQGWSSERLLWYIDYACRDDYGLTIDRTSAWAGVLYFAARLREKEETHQDVITWPAGNGFLVEYLTGKLRENLFANRMVCSIRQDDASVKSGEASQLVRLVTLEDGGKRSVGYTADHVIFTGPQFVARHVVENYALSRPDNAASFQYSAWLVANIHLKDRPKENGIPLCWDNVIYDSKSLGYVVSTHQTGADHGPTVITWYYPFAEAKPVLSREQLLQLKWAEWADVAIADLETAHPDIRPLIERVDIMRWGHAMVQPYPGFVWGQSRRQAQIPDRSIHYANTDLSGVALMEEAFYHGIRAAEEVCRVAPPTR